MTEHLAAAISGDSTALVQGSAGTSEEAIRYGWNYARLLAEGPSLAALVPSPLMRAMRDGSIARFEELTRIPSDVQDALITLLSEKTLPIPELDTEVQATKGFNIIATANDRDRGVNELSSALKRRFNTVILPLSATQDEEIAIVQKRVAELGRALDLPAEPPALKEIRRVVQIFRELRSGLTDDGKTKLKSPTSTPIGLFRLAFLVMLERTLTGFMKAAFQTAILRQPKLDMPIKLLGLMLVIEPFLPRPLTAGLSLALAVLLAVRLYS